MNQEQIYNYIKKQCELYGLSSEKIPGQGGWHFFKKVYHGGSCWAWYGEKTGKLRIDFCIDADESIREKVKAILKGQYELRIPKSTLHVFFMKMSQS